MRIIGQSLCKWMKEWVSEGVSQWANFRPPLGVYMQLVTHCGAMVSGICEWCHRRRLMSWVAFHRRHTETPWGRRIRNGEFWKIENPTCRNIPKQPEEKSLFNRSSRHVKTASRFHITGKGEGLRWCQLHSNLWHPLLHQDETVFWDHQ